MCTRMCACVCMCPHICVLVCIHVCSCVYAHICVLLAHACVHAHVCAHACVHVCVCSCVCLCTRMGVAIRFLAFSDSRGRTPTSHTTAPSRPCWAAGASGARGPDPQVLHQDLQSKPPSERTQNHWLGPGMATPSRGSTGPSREPLSVRRAGPRVQDCPGSRLGGPSHHQHRCAGWGPLPSQDPLSSQATSRMEAPRGSQGALPMPPAVSGVKARVLGGRAAPQPRGLES